MEISEPQSIYVLNPYYGKLAVIKIRIHRMQVIRKLTPNSLSCICPAAFAASLICLSAFYKTKKYFIVKCG